MTEETYEERMAEVVESFKSYESETQKIFKLYDAKHDYFWKQRTDLDSSTRFTLSSLINLQRSMSLKSKFAERFPSLTVEELLEEFFPPLPPKENSSD